MNSSGPPVSDSARAAHMRRMTTTPDRQPSGIPAGGQFAASTHSEGVVSLSPAANRRRSIAALRSQQLEWQERQESISARQNELDREVMDAATAVAAIDMLEVLPQASTLRYRTDGSEVVFVSATEADGTVIVDEDELADPDSPWRRDRTFQSAVRRTEESLEASGLPIRRRLDINVHDSIAKAASRLG